MKNTVTIGVLLLSLSACIQPPKPLRGEYSDVSPQAYQAKPVKNLNIRWTGFVVDVENTEQHSCLTIIAKVPDAVARPSKRVRVDQGRFIACKPKFLEPESFMKKPVTITGQVKRMVTKKIDDLEYQYPLVDAQVIYVW
ncbi:MAG: Slp family lipoprotein [Marinicella sp.]